MSAGSNTKLGVLLMVGTTMIFAIQDGLSLHLSSAYNVYMVVMVRYWFFAAFVVTVSAKHSMRPAPSNPSCKGFGAYFWPQK